MADKETFMLAEDPDASRAAAESLFERVTQELAQILPPSAEILHVGATAIPGCLTKGDLDVVVRVDSSEFATADAGIAAHFVRNHHSVRTAEFASFEDAKRTPHLGIQLTAKGGAFDLFHRFANVLRADSNLVRRYNDLKLANRNRPMADYRAAKDAFIADVLSTPDPRTE